MPAPKATCGKTYPHGPHTAVIEQVDWDWCGGAAFGACSNPAVHDVHRFETTIISGHGGIAADALCLGPALKPEGFTMAEINQPTGESMDTGVKSEPTIDRTAQAIRDWWIDLAALEVERVAPKAVEYGSTDLIEIGRDIAATVGWRDLSDETLAEIGIYFYMVGKMARWRDAIHRQTRVSDDTLHDIGVYVRMAQRVRAVGGWPFGPDEVDPFNPNGGI